MKSMRRIALLSLVLLGLVAGRVLGEAWRASRVAAQNKFGQPKTVIHVVIYKWKEGLSDADKQKALDSVKDLAAKVPGIKNIWLKPVRTQPREYSGVFAIEFASLEAAADYAEHPEHEQWSKAWQQFREASLSEQVTNP
jgi:hypothetical protein